MAAKKRSAKKDTVQPPNAGAVVEPKPPLRLTKGTGMHLTYHPEAGIVRLNVQQDVDVLGETTRQGRDIDIALDDLGTDIRTALEDALRWICEDHGATPYIKPED